MMQTEIVEALKKAIEIIESKEQPKEKKLTKREEIENYKKLLR